MTPTAAVRFTAAATLAIARDALAWLLEPACRWANASHFPIDEKDTDR